MRARIYLLTTLAALLLLLVSGSTSAAILEGLEIVAVAEGLASGMDSWDTEVTAEAGDMVMFRAKDSVDIDYWSDLSSFMTSWTIPGPLMAIR